MDGSSGAADHAHGVDAVHARIGDHKLADLCSVTDEARVAVVGRRAGAHTVIAAGASFEVDHHRCGAVDEARFHQLFEMLGVKLRRFLGRQEIRLAYISDWRVWDQLFGQVWEYNFFDHPGGDEQHVDVPNCAKRIPVGKRVATSPVVIELFKAKNLTLAQVAEGTVTVAKLFAYPRETTSNQDQPIRIVTLFRDDGFFLEPL